MTANIQSPSPAEASVGFRKQPATCLWAGVLKVQFLDSRVPGLQCAVRKVRSVKLSFRRSIKGNGGTADENALWGDLAVSGGEHFGAWRTLARGHVTKER